MEIQRSAFIDVPVTRYVAAENTFVADHKYTSEEVYFDIDLNGENFTTAFCSPVDFEDLVAALGERSPSGPGRSGSREKNLKGYSLADGQTSESWHLTLTDTGRAAA